MATTEIKQKLSNYVKKGTKGLDWVDNFNSLKKDAEAHQMSLHEYFATHILAPNPKKHRKKIPIPDPVQQIIEEAVPIEPPKKDKYKFIDNKIDPPHLEEIIEEDDGSVKVIRCPYDNCTKEYTQQHHFTKHLQTKHGVILDGQ